ncbi:MAG TPA: CpsB/CapC family capsule biosynthesis tyrosine phosphatase [Thermoleophilaceae bacterium]
MIDLHSHVLAGIDDGPQDLDGSLALARAASRDGTTTLAATPHARADHPRVQLENVANQCAELNELIPDSWGIEVVPGAEVDIAWAQSASEEQLRLATYLQRGTDILVETPYGPLPSTFEDLLFNLSVRGLRVVLAHPEWNPSFQTDPGRVAAMADRGVLVQITALSLVRPKRRSRARRLAYFLLEEGLAHLIASDSHSGGSWRPPQLRMGVEAASQVVSPARAEWMVTEAPAAVLAGEPLTSAPVSPPSRQGRSFLRRLTGSNGR